MAFDSAEVRSCIRPHTLLAKASDLWISLVACRRDSITADAAGRIGIFSLNLLSVPCVDIAAKVAGQILHPGKDSASNQVALDLENQIST
jgi:hypothetical protein